MKGAIWKLLLIATVVAGCVYSISPPKEKIRLGKDLRGGVSFVYAINVPDDANREEVIAQTIDVLKRRVNPQGVLDIAFQPQGANRMEVVMPLPSPEVRARQLVFQADLQNLILESAITRGALVASLEDRDALQRFGGDDPDRRAQIEMLQGLFDEAAQARQELVAMGELPEATPEELGDLENRIARAEVRSDQLIDDLVAGRLSEARVQAALALPGKERRKRGPDDVFFTIPSERDEQIAELRAEFPHLSAKLDTMLKSFADYAEIRTGLDDPEDLKRLLSGAGVLEFRIAVSAADPQGVNPAEMREQLADRGPRNTDSPVAAWYPLNDLEQWVDTPEQLTALKADPASYFTSRRLVAAERDGKIYILLYTTPEKSMTHEGDLDWTMQRTFRTVDELGRPAVGFALDPSGGRAMSALTGPNIQQPMAIVLDGQVYSAPNLNSRIGDRGVISGNFATAEVDYLIRVLAAGALDARLSKEPISTSVLGPSIGADNLGKGLQAVLLAVVVVAILMVCYYFFAGFVAVVALCMNALMVFGIMAMIDGTFTLPGLAGIALTIGMAVDASVLVYERIREEIVNNKEDLRIAIRLGYKKAASAIFDGNLTNLIVCFVLYQTAATEVRGFALTLSIGVLGTLFTTLFVGRFLFDVAVEGFGAKRFPGLMLPVVVPAIHRLLQPKIDWVSLRRVFQAFSISLAAAGLWLFFSTGSDILETEFRGGVSLTMSTREAQEGEEAGTEGRLLLSLSDVRDRLQAVGAAAPEGSAVSELRNATVLTSGPSTPDVRAEAFQVKVANPADATDEDAIEKLIVQAVVGEFADQLDIDAPVSFAGQNDSDHTIRTFSLERPTVEENIGRMGAGFSVGEFRGGVAVVIEDVEPPITADDVEQRIKRLRNQPDYADTIGRQVRVLPLGLDSKGDTYEAFCVLVSDEELSSFDVDLETWDAQLAKQEWELISSALLREASLEQVSSFSPTVAQNLVASAVVAVILSLLGMLVYIWIRFGDLWYSLAAVAALCFNVSVCLGAIAISVMVGSQGWAASLNIEEFRIDLNVIAGLLTIIGYSLNDTIVILDRVRENRGRLPYASRECVNNSINQTFSRTVLTSGTTIVTALILFNLGGTGIRPFAFTFLVGLIAATFSSVAIAAPMVYRRGGGAQAPADDGLVDSSPSAA